MICPCCGVDYPNEYFGPNGDEFSDDELEAYNRANCDAAEQGCDHITLREVAGGFIECADCGADLGPA